MTSVATLRKNVRTSFGDEVAPAAVAPKADFAALAAISPHAHGCAVLQAVLYQRYADLVRVVRDVDEGVKTVDGKALAFGRRMEMTAYGPAATEAGKPSKKLRLERAKTSVVGLLFRAAAAATPDPVANAKRVAFLGRLVEVVPKMKLRASALSEAYAYSRKDGSDEQASLALLKACMLNGAGLGELLHAEWRAVQATMMANREFDFYHKEHTKTWSAFLQDPDVCEALHTTLQNESERRMLLSHVVSWPFMDAAKQNPPRHEGLRAILQEAMDSRHPRQQLGAPGF